MSGIIHPRPWCVIRRVIWISLACAIVLAVLSTALCMISKSKIDVGLTLATEGPDEAFWLIQHRQTTGYQWVWARLVCSDCESFDRNNLTRSNAFRLPDPHSICKEGRFAIVITESVGFPFLAMHSRRMFWHNDCDYSAQAFQSSEMSGLQLDTVETNDGIMDGGAWNTRKWTVLPVAPLWGGLILNVFCYWGIAIVSLVFLSAFKWCFRLRRRARTSCIYCGHSLKGIRSATNGRRCPECGKWNM